MSISRRQFILAAAAGLGLPPYFSEVFASHKNTGDTPAAVMRPSHAFVRFDEIRLDNYGVFAGSHSFSFNENRTIVAIPNGSGKTTLFNALARLGPDPAVRPNMYSDNSDLTVEVLTHGNRGLVTKYRQLIFVDGESLDSLANDPDEAARDLSYAQDTNELKKTSWDIFRRLVERHSAYGSGYYPRLEESKDWSMAEKHLYGMAMVIAARSKLNVDLPLIVDAPFSCLDAYCREGLADYLDNLAGQQIMLISPYQVDQRYEVDYELAAADLRASSAI